MRDRRVGPGPQVLVEFSCREVTSPLDDRPLQPFDQCRFTDARVAAYENHDRVRLAGTVERVDEFFRLTFATVEFLRDDQPGEMVPHRNRERLDRIVRCQPLEAFSEIDLQPSCRLIAVFRVLTQQLENDCADHLGNFGRDFGG